jgi:hypothetical protein
MNTPNRDDFVTPQNNPSGVSAEFLKQLLEISKQHLVPKYYLQFCQETGLAAYAEGMVVTRPDEILPVSFDQISQYMAKIYDVMHDRVYPLFCHNLGGIWSTNTINSQLGKEIRPILEPIFKDSNRTPEEKVLAFAMKMNSYKTVLSQVFVPDGKTLLLHCKDCAYCKYIQTDKMVCMLVKAYFVKFISWSTQTTFSHQQLQSAAHGGAACIHSFSPVNL